MRGGSAEEALETEAEFVLALGGFALRLPGALLVTHEKIPVPRFNFVLVRGVSAQRQTSFFEHALDHYFQRALRPTFRVVPPVPPHLDRGLRRLGFVPRSEPLSVHLEGGASAPSEGRLTIRPAEDDDLDALAGFWTAAKERPEFRTAVDIAWHHPNPGERLQPIVAERDRQIVSAALLYRHGTHVGIFLVSTAEGARGQGAASDLVRYVLRERPLGLDARYTIFSDSTRLGQRLERLGFTPTLSLVVYELPAGAELSLPHPGPPGPPQWRPPRR